jgi:long-chain acyl-CoA synthetase
VSASSLNLCALFQSTAAARGDAPALTMTGHPGFTWREYAGSVSRLAPGLAALGVARGGCVALLMAPRPEFHLIDTSVLHAGGTPFSLQQGDALDNHVRSLRVSGAHHLVTEAGLLDEALVIARAHGTVQVICVDLPVPQAGVLSMADVESGGGPAFERLWRAVDPEDIATLIFTSGTTGPPKAVQLSHRAIAVSEHSTHALAPFLDPDGTVLSYLPLNHIAERFMSHYASLAYGVTIRSVPDPDRLYDEIRKARPVRFFGVPRVYEKLADRAMALVDADPVLQDALAAGLRGVRAAHSDQTPSAGAGRACDDGRATLAGVRKSLGLDRAEYLAVATAPAAYAMLERLHAVGLRVCDLWGMSEAIMCTLNPPGAVRLGTVGVFLDGVEGRIADDGEILVRGPNTFSGYLGDPERTAEIWDPDGWIHTGDVGSIDDGYLSIRGRKKELLVTATGKNIAPGHIEGALKSASPLVDHAVAIAEGRRYVTALLSLDPDAVAAFAAAHGLEEDPNDLARHDEIRSAVDRAVAAANQTLARAETVRRVHIAPTAWSAGGDELTSTAKLRRDRIAEKYSAEIEEMYQ